MVQVRYGDHKPLLLRFSNVHCKVAFGNICTVKFFFLSQEKLMIVILLEVVKSSTDD
ncbi:unnamed protein product, partial [Vitis vinifera]